MKLEFYKHIDSDHELQEIKSILTLNNIPYEVSSPETIIEKSIVGTGNFAKYTLKLLPSDFKLVNDLIQKQIVEQEVNTDDYPHLNMLSNEELLKIIVKPGDWAVKSEHIARSILKERNVAFNEEDVLRIRLEKLESVRNGKSVPLLVQLSFFAMIAVGAFFSYLFILAGLGMGYYYAYGYSIDNEGVKHYVYNEKARKNGEAIFYLGILVLTIYVVLLFNFTTASLN